MFLALKNDGDAKEEMKMYPPALVCLLVIVWVSIIFYDLRYRIIPDLLVLILLSLGLYQYFGEVEHFLCAAMLGAGGALLKIGMEKLLKRPSLGWGDVKLMAALGLGMTPDQLPFFLTGAGLAGCVWGTCHKIISKESTFPFAPSLILSFLLVVWYLC